MNKKLWILGLAVSGLLVAVGCTKENAEDAYGPAPVTCDTTNVTYSGVVQPIIAAKCATSGCHLGAGASGWDLSNYHGVLTSSEYGVLMPAINHTGPSPMPKGQAKLDDCSIAKIQKWVNDGAPNN